MKKNIETPEDLKKMLGFSDMDSIFKFAKKNEKKIEALYNSGLIPKSKKTLYERWCEEGKI